MIGPAVNQRTDEGQEALCPGLGAGAESVEFLFRLPAKSIQAGAKAPVVLVILLLLLD